MLNAAVHPGIHPIASSVLMDAGMAPGLEVKAPKQAEISGVDRTDQSERLGDRSVCLIRGAGQPVGCRKSELSGDPPKTGYDQPPSMLLFVLYACLRLLIDLVLAPHRDRAADQAELLVLRHQVCRPRTPCEGCPLAASRSSRPRRPRAPAPKALLVHAAVQARNGAPLAPRAGAKDVGELRRSSSQGSTLDQRRVPGADPPAGQ